MNNRVLMAAGLLATASVLGGCASIFGKPFAMKSRADINEVDVNDYFAARLAAGKHHLREGRPAQAAIAFRQASYDPKVAAEAFNGMAISFAKLGRNDLASEYFALAIERDPADERFARNLARFEATLPAMAQPDVVTEMLAQAEPEAPAAAAVQVEERKLASGTTLAIGAAAAQIQRVSAREVHIGGGASAGPVAVAAQQAMAPQVKVHHVRALSPSRSTNTIRIGFSEPKAGGERPTVYEIKSEPAASSYPVRVALGPKNDKED